MSRNQYLKTLHSELVQLNDKIDRKIMLGRKYAAEARRHRMILIKLRRHAKSPSFGQRVGLSLASLFNYA